jgi:hypothetical protein
VGNCIKSKYPNRLRKAGKYGTYNDTTGYLFGFDQLPTKGKYLIVASGEDDTLCINHHLNALGVFSVCAWNETTTPPSDLLNGLKTRFERLFYLGDNDNPQTTKASQDIALKTGLTWIDTSNARAYFGMPNEWDICDIHQQRQQVKDFVLHCLGANHRLTSYEDDPDSMAIDHCYKLDFAQHIGQDQPNKYGIKPLDFILHQIKQHDRLILESLAGTGKSTVLTKIVHQGNRPTNTDLISPNLQYLSNLGIERVIILEPTTAINAQLPEAFKEVGLTVAAIDNLADENDLLTALESRVLMVCYDSLKKVYHLLPNALVIVDEYHQLPIDINFRSPTAFRLVMDGLQQAKKVLLLSATPNYLFTLPKEVYNGFGYKLIKGVPSIQNQIIITPLAYEGKRMDVPSYIFENSPKEQGVITIKFDSKANLGAFTKSLTDMGISADFFHSGNPANKENNINYQSVMKTGYLKEPLRFLSYTTLMEAGVSIKDDVILNCLVDVESWQKTIQLISRARYNHSTGTNALHKVWIFRSTQSLSKENPYKQPPLIDRFNALLNRANRLCNAMNDSNLIDGSLKFTTENDHQDIKNTTYKDDLTGLYKPCVLWILRTLYEQEKSAPFDLLLKRVQRFDNRVQLLPIETIQTIGHPDMELIRQAQKATKEDANNRLLDLVLSDTKTTAQTVCYLSKNADFKERVRSVLKLPQVQKNTLIDFLEDAKGAFTGNEPNRLMNDICFMVESYPNRPLFEIVKTIIETDKKTIKDIKSQQARKQRKKAIITNEVSNHDKMQNFRELEIVKRFDQVKKDSNRGKRSEWLTAKQITDITNKALKDFNKEKGEHFKLVNERKAMIGINDLYHVETTKVQKDKKRFWAYKIGDRKGTKTALFFD